jgi:hypothetical protein
LMPLSPAGYQHFDPEEGPTGPGIGPDLGPEEINFSSDDI